MLTFVDKWFADGLVNLLVGSGFVERTMKLKRRVFNAFSDTVVMQLGEMNDDSGIIYDTHHVIIHCFSFTVVHWSFSTKYFTA